MHGKGQLFKALSEEREKTATRRKHLQESLHSLVAAAQVEEVMAASPAKHAFTFTPSVSLFVGCADEAELDKALAALSEGGGVLMPPNNYGFSRKFTWVNDRFGVSWQLTQSSVARLPLGI